MLQLGEKRLPQDFGKDNLTLSLTKLTSFGYFSAFFAFIRQERWEKIWQYLIDPMDDQIYLFDFGNFVFVVVSHFSE